MSVPVRCQCLQHGANTCGIRSEGHRLDGLTVCFWHFDALICRLLMIFVAMLKEKGEICVKGQRV